MMVVVDLPFVEEANEQLQRFIDEELGAGTFVVKRTQLLTGTSAGYRFQAIVDELERAPALVGAI